MQTLTNGFFLFFHPIVRKYFTFLERFVSFILSLMLEVYVRMCLFANKYSLDRLQDVVCIIEKIPAKTQQMK